MELEATRFSSSSTLLWRPFFPDHQKQYCRKRITVHAFGGGTNGRDYGGRLVDEGMVELRQRIREAKMLEVCNNPPSHWMEWEKQYFADYNYKADVCEAIGWLQNYLTSNRPSLALGIVVLVALSLVISSGVVFSRAVEMAITILSGSRL
ncbi:hypothetical protein Tsubulata_003962 [Turnera subulata]|uniref:Uncharacterized protein n=1 Tax=Turnera subulata TaxID=218843 RepID=A0A9Q0GEC9_9ROSI|nr:hypothetical protein Tsubulata_003962 [Turnera subulata]